MISVHQTLLYKKNQNIISIFTEQTCKSRFIQNCKFLGMVKNWCLEAALVNEFPLLVENQEKIE